MGYVFIDFESIRGFSPSGCSKTNPPNNTPQYRYRKLVIYISAEMAMEQLEYTPFTPKFW
jgi:hypothetical protein